MTADATAFAPAKINLTLHVTGQRDDGYHLLDSLVVFADIGDQIHVSQAADLALDVSGPMAQGVPTDRSNLVLKAAALLPAGQGAHIHLHKTLPPASGIGGGSSDAAAALRALSSLWRVPMPGISEALALGADLPVCLQPGPQRMRGIGETISRVPNLPPCDIVLVNPRREVSTPAIFKSLKRRDNPAMPEVLPNWADAADLANWLAGQRNDMQAAAIALEPSIADVLHSLTPTGCLMARMSGSGATCFGLFPPDGQSAARAAKRISQAHPGWWVEHGSLLP